MRRLLLAAIIVAASQAYAQHNKVGDGKALVEANCAGCHAVGANGASPHSQAPAFRLLHLRYPVESLAEALAEGISTGHPDMPEFVATPDQIEAILTYINSLSSQ